MYVLNCFRNSMPKKKEKTNAIIFDRNKIIVEKYEIKIMKETYEYTRFFFWNRLIFCLFSKKVISYNSFLMIVHLFHSSNQEKWRRKKNYFHLPFL